MDGYGNTNSRKRRSTAGGTSSVGNRERPVRLVAVDTMFPDPSVVCIGVTARFLCPGCGHALGVLVCGILLSAQR